MLIDIGSKIISVLDQLSLKMGVAMQLIPNPSYCLFLIFQMYSWRLKFDDVIWKCLQSTEIPVRHRLVRYKSACKVSGFQDRLQGKNLMILPFSKEKMTRYPKEKWPDIAIQLVINRAAIVAVEKTTVQIYM